MLRTIVGMSGQEETSDFFRYGFLYYFHLLTHVTTHFIPLLIYSHIGNNIAIIATMGVVSFNQCGTWAVNSASIRGRNKTMAIQIPIKSHLKKKCISFAIICFVASVILSVSFLYVKTEKI